VSGISTINMHTPAINAAPVELPADTAIHTLTPVAEQTSRREERAAVIATRSKDPGVIVDVPGGLTAEEVRAAKSKEGMGMDA
jgi:hypothetical protein